MPTTARRIEEIDETSEFAAAYEQYRSIRNVFREKGREHDRLVLALQITSTSTPAPVQARNEPLLASLAAEIAAANGNPSRVRRMIDRLFDEIEDLRPLLAEAKRRYEIAADAEAARLAEQYRPAHKRAVARVASALEELSAALAEETDVRVGFEKQSPLNTPSDHLMPNFSAALKSFAWLPDWNSRASEWGREAHRRGYL